MNYNYSIGLKYKYFFVLNLKINMNKGKKFEKNNTFSIGLLYAKNISWYLYAFQRNIKGFIFKITETL